MGDLRQSSGTSAMAKSLLFLTATRADYGKLEPLALAALDAGHRVSFFVTGMHMMGRYGMTKVEVHRSGRFDVVEFINHRDGDPQDIVLAKTVIGLSDYLKEYRPDLVVVHGDRIEALAGCLVCATNYLLCAHIEGGEVSGNIDEQLRHCNTKLASIHLVSSESAKDRVVRLGEDPSSVHVIGSPELDTHSQPSGVALSEVMSRYDIASDDYGICVFHPVTSEVDSIGTQARQLFDALVAAKRYFVVILPNNDPGAKPILEVISWLPSDRFRVLPSMRFAYFSELMRNAKVIIGNSSIGVREAPFLGIPSLDVGTRQANRVQAESVHSCQADSLGTIMSFIDSNWGRRFAAHVGFGAGNAARRFRDLLGSPEFWSVPRQKQFVE